MKSYKNFVVAGVLLGSILGGIVVASTAGRSHQNAADASMQAQMAEASSLNAQAQPAANVTASPSGVSSASTTNNGARTATVASVTGVTLSDSDRQFLSDIRDLSQHSFSDVPLDSPYYDATLILQILHIFNGYTDGTMGLNQPMSRAQAAAVLNRLFLFSLDYNTDQAFNDVPAANIHAKAINAMFWAGITNGCSASPRNFCPEQAITRKQFITLLGKSLFLPITSQPAAFTDVSANDSANTYLAALKPDGIVTGCTATTFCPDNALTRAQAVTIIARLLAGNSNFKPNATL
ncbi:MAG TPA: S-layer homology domain-containing protein [Candidatus Saccharimonadales bacterium]|nr:S-layer homology domain-containing protein [Candidatus Saccharimonadales bacterium]